MALARYESVATNTSGDVVPNATVEVRRDQPGRPVVPLWADREGTVALGNPITADSEGKFGFHVTGGSYYIRVFTGPSQQPLQQYVRRYQAIGTAGERDVEDLASALEAGTATYPTLAELQAFVPLEAGIGGKVTTGEDAGFYHYDFGTSAWVFDRPLFDTLARMNVTGGDANDIVAEITSGVADSAVVMLWIEAAATNTGPVTINAKPVKTIDGNDLLAGQWLAGRTYWFSDEGTFYKLRTESDVSGLVAQAEAAATAAQEAQGASETARTGAETARDEAQGYAAGLNIAPIAPGDVGKVLQVNVTEDGSDWVDLPDPDGDKGDIIVSSDGTVFEVADSYKAKVVGVVGDRAALAGMAGADYLAIDLMETGRRGRFVWDGSNLAAKVTIDTQQGVYVPPTSDATGASGAWVRQFNGDLWANWFGLASANTGTQNVVAINAAISLAANLKIGTALPTGEFDIAVIGTPGGLNNGIKLVSNTHLYGQGSRYTILNLVGNSTSANLNNFNGGSGIGRTFTPGVANSGVNNAIVEDLAVVMNHPGDSVAVYTQIGVDFRNMNRCVLRRCWVGNYHPRLNTKGFTQEYLVQGYAVAIGGAPGGNVDYAHTECNVIEDNAIIGAFHGVSMEWLGTNGGAYRTVVQNNDIQTCHTLILQNHAGGAGNVFKNNILQNLVHPAGNANPTRGLYMAGYGNIVEEPYGEYGSDAQYICYLAASARRNRLRYSATHSVAGGLTGSFVDNGGASSYNIIEYFTNTGGAGTYVGEGAPVRMISGVPTTQT